MRDVALEGHGLTFSDAINAVLANLATVFSVPKWLLGELTGFDYNMVRPLAHEWGS